jgi:hypothetical protein
MENGIRPGGQNSTLAMNNIIIPDYKLILPIYNHITLFKTGKGSYDWMLLFAIKKWRVSVGITYLIRPMHNIDVSVVS